MRRFDSCRCFQSLCLRMAGQRVRIVYIAGAAHSGSTLLDMMLNAHASIVSVGELINLNRTKVRKGKPKPAKCACGAVGLMQCAFWSRVDSRVRELSGRSIADLHLHHRPAGRGDVEPNTVLFRAIADVSGKDIIVDSSKMPGRLKQLMGLEGLDVYPLHLMRQPSGQIASAIGRKGLLKSILQYEMVHARLRQMLKAVPHGSVKYEKLVTDPAPTLQRILHPLGLQFEPGQLAFAEQERHSFAGNHARFRRRARSFSTKPGRRS
jgi:hypothetical protein